MRKAILALTVVLVYAVNVYGQNNTIDEIINRAVRVNPEVKALEAEIQAAAYRIPQNSNLPDPSLTVGVANLPVNTFSFEQEAMTGKVIALTQGLPFPGKLDARAEFDAVDTAIVRQDLNETVNKLKLTIKTNLFELAWLNKAIEIEEKRTDIYRELSDVVQQKYSVGEASQQDVFKLDYELTAINDRLTTLQSEKDAVINTVRTYLLDNSADVSPAQLNEIDSLYLDAEALTALSKEYRPVLKKSRLMITKAEKQRALAKFAFYPDFKISAQYMQRERIDRTNTDLTDVMSLTAGVEIPINYGGKHSAKIKEAEIRKEQFEERYKSSLQILGIEFVNSLEKMNNLVKTAGLIKTGYAVQADYTFRAALSSYQVGKIDFINVVQAVNNIFKAELDLAKTKTGWHKESAKLEFLTGTGFENIQEIKNAK